MSKEYIIYADESDKKGAYFSNFYGGLLVRSEHLDSVRQQLDALKINQNLHQEIKWGKVTSQYLSKYQAVMDGFFDLVAADQIKIRVMFTQNARVPVGLEEYQREHGYHLLYYQFIRHAFGLRYCNNSGSPVNLRIYLDNMPHTREKNEQFKGYLQALQHTTEFCNKLIRIRREDIVEVASHDHVLLQYVDVVLGSIQFRLNDKHLQKPPGASRRGKRTVAKHKLYKHIYGRICEVHPHFNIGISTGTQGDYANRWRDPYRHWLFTPKNFRLDRTRTKKN